MGEQKRKPGRPRGSGGAKHQWDNYREEWINRHLSGDYITPEAFAIEKKLNPRTVEFHAQRDGWHQQVNVRLNQQHNAVSKHSSEVLASIRKQVDFDEKEIRTRHGNAMKGLMAVALKKLVKIAANPDDLTVDQMIAILKFAPQEERRAFGLPDTVVEVEHKIASKAMEEFERRVQQRAKTAGALLELSRIVEGEAKEVKDDDESDKR